MVWALQGLRLGGLELTVCLEATIWIHHNRMAPASCSWGCCWRSRLDS